MRTKLKKIIASWTSVCVLVAPTMSYAGINHLLDNIVNNSYYQAPGLIKSPTTNTLTLGSYSFRLNNNLLNMPVLSINPPQATLSCAGEDFNAGMISMLNLKMLGHMLSQAGASIAWGIMIGLVYSLPGVADAFQKLDEWARKIQGLFSNSCMMGVEVGRSIGSSIFERGKNQAVGKAVGSGTIGTFEDAWESLYDLFQQTNEEKHFFGDIPYGPLYETGWTDTQTADLIASLFGVIDWRAVYTGSDGQPHTCTTQTVNVNGNEESCLQVAKIKVFYHPPLINNLDVIMNGDASTNGGAIWVYHCNWQPTSIGAFMCVGGVHKQQETITEGLVDKVRDKIDTIVSNIANGGYVPGPHTAGWIASVPLPDFTNILNYLAILKKRGSENQNINVYYEDALEGVSELVAAYMLKALVDNSYNAISSEGTYLSNKDVPESLQKEEGHIDRIRQQLEDYINKNMQENYYGIQVASETYQSLKSFVEHSFYQRFGKSTQLFMKQ